MAQHSDWILTSPQALQPRTTLLAVGSDLLFSCHDHARLIHRPILLLPLGKSLAGPDDADFHLASPPLSPLGKTRDDHSDEHLLRRLVPGSPRLGVLQSNSL